MLEQLIVENFNRFEVILNPQLGNIDRRGKYLELKLIYVRGGLVIVPIICSIVILPLLLLVVIILIQRGPARHSPGHTGLPPYCRLLGVSTSRLLVGGARLSHRFGLKYSGCFRPTEIVISVHFFPFHFIFKVE